MSFEPAHFVQVPPEKLRGFFAATGLDEVEQMDVLLALRHKATAIDVRFVAHEAPELVLLAESINEKDIPRALHDQFVELGADLEQLGAGQRVDAPVDQGLLLLPGLGKCGLVDLIAGFEQGRRLDSHAETVALDVSRRAMHEVFELPSLPRFALHHGFASQSVQYLEQLPSRHVVTPQQLGFEKLGGYFTSQNIVDYAKIKVFERVAGERECGLLDIPSVLLQKVAAIGFLSRKIPLGKQGKHSSDRRARNTQRLRERLLAQGLTGPHRPGANHVDDLRRQLQGKVFLDHRLSLEWSASVCFYRGRPPNRTGVGKYHTRQCRVSAPKTQELVEQLFKAPFLDGYLPYAEIQRSPWLSIQ